MNRKEQIAFWKRQIVNADENKLVAKQNLELAARLKSEAEAALQVLVVSNGRARKGYELSDSEKLSLTAGLTK